MPEAQLAVGHVRLEGTDPTCLKQALCAASGGAGPRLPEAPIFQEKSCLDFFFFNIGN